MVGGRGVVAAQHLPHEHEEIVQPTFGERLPDSELPIPFAQFVAQHVRMLCVRSAGARGRLQSDHAVGLKPEDISNR
jgi:hypothetical protein